MPIVRAYTDSIPSDIRGIHRITSQQHHHITPHFYFDDSLILRYWNKPFETEKILSNFTASIGIDFSMTNEMSRQQKNICIEISTIAIYKEHKCIGQIDLKFDQQGDFVPFTNSNNKSSHYHKFTENTITGLIGRISGKKENHHPINSKYTSLIQKIINFNKAHHK